MVYTMEFSVALDVFEQYPDLAIGVIIATGIENTAANPEIAECLRRAEEQVRTTLDAKIPESIRTSQRCRQCTGRLAVTQTNFPLPRRHW